MKNTVIDYAYVDASNYKAHPEQLLNGRPAIVAGELTPEQQADIVRACEGGEYFIAGQVGLPELQEVLWDRYSRNDDDHVFHTLSGFSQTDAAPTVEVTAAELHAAFAKVDRPDGWDVIGAMQRLGIEA